MALFDRIASGALRNSESGRAATPATFATDDSSVATVATVATVPQSKTLTTFQLNELRRLIDIACEPHEREEMFAYALPFGIDSLTTYRGIAADRELDEAEMGMVKTQQPPDP